ncbi:MAG: NAD(P)/FAD-dependent oxidoreductase [Candidatus Diapherotrites archaeon]|uniref:NAD(P)/FAD-dependent oxidoreductase n=1 Tax=Candidatus Iainarchaeum sp. TaxID=3101447 RepID=A0A8T4L0L9_9ARCH|nr:NAD(P)/FAD-dependent oxidoreductase [Candidatus Diapherotrites archaeon]
MEHFDVIVIGLGPAGLAACKVLAEKKISVLGLDRKQEIGPPKRCAEGLGIAWFRRLKIKPNPEFAVHKIYGAVLFSPNGKSVTLKSKKLQGYILERKIFEKHLAISAAAKGAKITAKTDVLEAKRENGKILLTANQGGETKHFSCSLVIAADGIDSMIARELGLNTSNKLVDVDSGYQYEMTNIEGYDEKLLNLYFGTDVAPRGYLWVFPKRKNTANVGIGIGGTQKETAKFYLDKFIASKPGLAKGSIIEVNAGVIPVGGFLENMTKDNLIAAGDAAHHVDPVHGGGIGIAMEAGMIAAQVASEAVKKKDFSEKFLSKYNKMWYEKRGNELKKKVRIRHLLENLSNEDFDYLAESLSIDDVLKIASADLDKKARLAILGKKMLQRPGLAKIMLKYI